MAVSSWLRLWLPLGNVLLLIAIVETVDFIRNELKDLGIFISQGLTLQTDIAEFYSMPELIFLSVTILIRLISIVGLLWIGTIIKGNKCCLLAWTVISVISSVGISIFLVISAVAISHPMDTRHAWSMVYTLTLFVILNIYVIYIAGVSYQALRRQEVLHPIGKGLSFMWDHFSNETKAAATFFLTSEIVLDVEYLLSRQFVQFFGITLQGHDGDSYHPIIAEEIVLRIIRIVTNGIGLWLVSTERRRVFRWWCGFTFLLIHVSTIIFIILTVQWRGEDISYTLAYFVMFPGHLLYRYVTLYFCLKFTRADFSHYIL